MSDAKRIRQLAEELAERYPATETLELNISDTPHILRSNQRELLDELEVYFRHFATSKDGRPIEVTAIECPEPDWGFEYRDWPREGGKTGRKDAFCDLEDGRVLYKVRTGMRFLLNPEVHVALGPCRANSNRVINFVNALFMNRLLAQDWTLCHAAGVVHKGRGLAIAGISGAGKSTLALHLIGRGLSFTSNDRLLVRQGESGASMSGVPKMPRINPGTALNNPHLSPILSDERKQALADMPKSELWELEEKYDADIGELFGPSQIEMHAPLDVFFILSWKHDAKEEPAIRQVDIAERDDLLAAVMKSPGPFHLPADGGRPLQPMPPDKDEYIRNLAGVRIFELSGRVDFDWACEEALTRLEG